MKRIIKTQLAFALALIFFIGIGGCKKYEEGPGFSLKRKKARLTGTWISVSKEGRPFGNEYTIEIKSNGEYSSSYIDYLLQTQKTEGTWKWGDKKESIIFVSDGNRYEDKIIKLTNKEFWTSDDNDESYFKKK